MLKLRLGKNSKKLTLLLMTVFLLVALSVSSFASPPSDESLIKEVVTNYYDTRHQALSSLEEKDISVFWNSNNNLDYEVELAALSADISHRKMQLIDLGIKKYDLKMDFSSVDIKGNKAEVKAVERCSFYQNASPDVCSKMRNQHIIKLKNINGKWLIESDDCSDDFTKEMILDKIKEKKSVSQAKAEILETSKEQVKLRKEEVLNFKKDVQPDFIVSPLALNTYNVDDAVDYALYWAERRNDEWHDYSGDSGGDCTNFVSQCLYAGGIPFDTVGNANYNQRWFWRSESDRTPTWTGVVPFWDYAINDTGVGLVAASTTRTGIYTGDVVQFYTSAKGWHHSLFVNNAYTYNNYRFIFICCHSADKTDYNIDNYTGKTMRYMHISGWNN